MTIYQKIILLLFSIILLAITILLVFGILSSIIFLIYSILIIFVTSLFIFISRRTLPKHKKIRNQFNINTQNPIIFSTRSVFPLQFFQDKYVVQEKALYIVRKTFFATAWTEMIPIKDIASVRIYVGPIFSSLTILRKLLPTTSIELRDLWKKDGMKMKEVLDGLIMSEAKIVNIPDQIPDKDKKELIIEVGTEREVEKEI